jgi:hypothetical protein
MKPSAAFLLRPEFAFPNIEDGKRLFASRLSRARDKIKSKNKSSAFNSAALEHDRTLHPVPAFNHQNEPRWDGSVAQMHLKKDIADGKQQQMAPKVLHKSQPEYSAYPLAIFCDHIYQEERLQKFILQCRA